MCEVGTWNWGSEREGLALPFIEAELAAFLLLCCAPEEQRQSRSKHPRPRGLGCVGVGKLGVISRGFLTFSTFSHSHAVPGDFFFSVRSCGNMLSISSFFLCLFLESFFLCPCARSFMQN